MKSKTDFYFWCFVVHVSGDFMQQPGREEGEIL